MLPVTWPDLRAGLPPKLRSTLHQAACAQPHHLALPPNRAELLFSSPCALDPALLSTYKALLPCLPLSLPICTRSSSDGPCPRRGKLIEARAQGVCGPGPRGLRELIRLVQTWDFLWNVVLNQGALRTRLGVLKHLTARAHGNLLNHSTLWGGAAWASVFLKGSTFAALAKNHHSQIRTFLYKRNWMPWYHFKDSTSRADGK